ncbi:MAG: hypothetical protein JO038_01710 [Alphaproteobacteria bacterium]|nr:hypothetical protein [Alphaproteobacteria bacterium]
MPRLFALGLSLVLCSASAMAQMPAGSPFDGRWLVVLACPPSTDGALPFTWRFYADVRGGVLHGEYGTVGQPASMSLDGRIQPDGLAQLVAQGLTGVSAYNVNQAARGIPFRNDVPARFDTNRGAGNWVYRRTCEFSFTRQ